jgi:hypothetical protein
VTRRVATRLAAAYGLQVTRSQIGDDMWGVIFAGRPVWFVARLAIQLESEGWFDSVEAAMRDIKDHLPEE